MGRMNAMPAEDDVARVPFRTVLLSILGLWLTYFALVTLRGELVELDFNAETLARRALACLIGAAVTFGLWLVLRLFDGHRPWLKILAALVLSLPVAVLAAQGNQMAFRSMEERHLRAAAEEQGFTVRRSASGDLLVDIPAMGTPSAPGQSETNEAPPSATITADLLQGSYWQQITEVAFGRYFMLLAWCALYLALLTGEKARASERREGEFRRAAKAAELRSLRYQVNPHFLFNTLNSLSALVLTGKPDAAERMIQTISTFYRRSLAADPTADVPLREEIALQKLYLDIEAVRFPQRLRTEYVIPPELEETLVPGMILQPLVENSVKHAVAPTSGQVTITLSAREEHGRLIVTVSDDGQHRTSGHERSAGHGIGLANVRERIQARFGDEASVVSGPSPGGYATILRLPLLRHGGMTA
jgi:hypothetical protein